mgnify:CR=1 FL=1
MDTTDRFEIPLIAPSQAQKHVTHNEAVVLADGLLHLVLDTIGLNSPPPGATAPSAHAVGPAPVGVWSGHAGGIALLTSGGWLFLTPKPGMVAYRSDLALLVVYSLAGVWENISEHFSLSRLDTLGIGTDPDSTNRFSVKSNAALLTALEAAGGGNGDFRLALNRELSSDVAAILFQSGYSGRAEFGLPAGAGDFELKTSADGTIWQTVLKAKTSGELEVGNLRTPSGSSYWHAANDGAGSGLDADLLDGSDGSFYRDAGNLNAGTINVARLPSAVKADATAVAAGSVDWDTITSMGWYANLILGTNPNGPGGASYYHVLVARYSSVGWTQIAIPYGATLLTLGANSPVFLRGHYSGTWTGWQRLSTEARNDARYLLASAYTAADVFAKVLTLDGSGSGLMADKVQAYATGGLPSASSRGAGAIILVTGLTPALLAYSDGTNWRAVTDASVVT